MFSKDVLPSVQQQDALQINFFQQAPVKPLFIQTTQQNIDNIKADKPYQDLSNYQSKAMNGQSHRLQFVQQLGGRGQDGFAGFFGPRQDESRQYLIKVDDPATCILEATAQFSERLLSSGHDKAVNFAYAGILQARDVEKDTTKTEVISIQPRVSSLQNTIKPWDSVVYGHKRKPKTIRSEESQHSEQIINNIATMTDDAKWDLANAVFASTVVGDESLHIGQFMAEVDEHKQVVGITRIDFGARERYSAERYRVNDFSHQTSEKYKSSGQFGKDYISYLLASPELKYKYLALWSRDMDIDAAANSHAELLKKEVTKLPEEQQEKALNDIVDVVFKKTSNQGYIALQKELKALPLDAKITRVAKTLKVITKKRMNSLQTKAQQQLIDTIHNQFKLAGRNLTQGGIDTIRHLILNTEENTASKLSAIKSYLSNKVINGQPEHAQYYATIAKIFFERQLLSQDANISPKAKQAIQGQLQSLYQLNLRFTLIAELSKYQSYINSKSMNAHDKQVAIEQAIRGLQAESQFEMGKFANEPENIITEQFISTLSKRRISPDKDAKSKGHLLCEKLERILAKYNQEPEQQIREDNHHLLQV